MGIVLDTSTSYTICRGITGDSLIDSLNSKFTFEDFITENELKCNNKIDKRSKSYKGHNSKLQIEENLNHRENLIDVTSSQNMDKIIDANYVDVSCSRVTYLVNKKSHKKTDDTVKCNKKAHYLELINDNMNNTLDFAEKDCDEEKFTCSSPLRCIPSNIMDP